MDIESKCKELELQILSTKILLLECDFSAEENYDKCKVKLDNCLDIINNISTMLKSLKDSRIPSISERFLIRKKKKFLKNQADKLIQLNGVFYMKKSNSDSNKI